MRYILTSLIIMLAGCSSPYERSYRGLTDLDDSNYPLLYSIEWVKSRNTESLVEERKVAESDLGTCVAHLEKENKGLATKSVYVATVQIIECMRDKEWYPKHSEITITR